MWDLRFSQQWLWRMSSSGMLRHMVVVRTDVSEECIVSIIRVTRIGELGTTLAVTSNWSMLWRNIMSYDIVFLCSMLRLLVTAIVVPSSLILVILMMVICSSKTSALIRGAWCNIPEDGTLQQKWYIITGQILNKDIPFAFPSMLQAGKLQIFHLVSKLHYRVIRYSFSTYLLYFVFHHVQSPIHILPEFIVCYLWK
jgi:hypothetical protein